MHCLLWLLSPEPRGDLEMLFGPSWVRQADGLLEEALAAPEQCESALSHADGRPECSRAPSGHLSLRDQPGPSLLSCRPSGPQTVADSVRGDGTSYLDALQLAPPAGTAGKFH